MDDQDRAFWEERRQSDRDFWDARRRSDRWLSVCMLIGAMVGMLIPPLAMVAWRLLTR